jgi:hypothetical protein
VQGILDDGKKDSTSGSSISPGSSSSSISTLHRRLMIAAIADAAPKLRAAQVPHKKLMLQLVRITPLSEPDALYLLQGASAYAFPALRMAVVQKIQTLPKPTTLSSLLWSVLVQLATEVKSGHSENAALVALMLLDWCHGTITCGWGVVCEMCVHILRKPAQSMTTVRLVFKMLMSRPVALNPPLQRLLGTTLTRYAHESFVDRGIAAVAWALLGVVDVPKQALVDIIAPDVIWNAWEAFGGMPSPSSMPTTNTCAICMECSDVKGLVAIGCRHVFHAACIRKWRRTCPVCRVPVMDRIQQEMTVVE